MHGACQPVVGFFTAVGPVRVNNWFRLSAARTDGIARGKKVQLWDMAGTSSGNWGLSRGLDQAVQGKPWTAFLLPPIHACMPAASMPEQQI